MKELSIEEKAKRYDEALKVAKSKIKNDKDHVLYEYDVIEIFPELKESEDEKVEKAIFGMVYDSDNELWSSYGVSKGDVLSWLEKQDEQKPTDKVEPKFHEGEWITNGDYTWQIVSVTDLDYILQSQDGNTVDDTISHVDEQFHSFTTEDAKAGDVLTDGVLPFIFKKIDSNKYCYAYCGISVDDGFKIESEGKSGEWTWMQDIKPATKEQRDTLLKAMTDAGYTFDFEKKKLKKIEQKPAWTEEDDAILKTLICDINALSYMESRYWKFADRPETILNFLKSLKNKIQPQPKQEWSEEDKKLINDTCHLINTLASGYGEKVTEPITFSGTQMIASIKNRLMALVDNRPQNRWKPSDEQMEVLLSEVKAWTKGCPKQIVLESLYEQLKKLREEDV